METTVGRFARIPKLIRSGRRPSNEITPSFDEAATPLLPVDKSFAITRRTKRNNKSALSACEPSDDGRRKKRKEGRKKGRTSLVPTKENSAVRWLSLYIRNKIRLHKIYAKLARESQKYKTNPEITFYTIVRSMRGIFGRDAVIVFKNVFPHMTRKEYFAAKECVLSFLCYVRSVPVIS